jgi:hypothetical protein
VRKAGRKMRTVDVTEPPVTVKWYYRPVWVLVLLFLVLGPLGLPYLWRSPRFSRGAKIALTAGVIAYTGMLIVETVRIVQEVRDEMKELQIDLD